MEGQEQNSHRGVAYNQVKVRQGQSSQPYMPKGGCIIFFLTLWICMCSFMLPHWALWHTMISIEWLHKNYTWQKWTGTWFDCWCHVLLRGHCSIAKGVAWCFTATLTYSECIGAKSTALLLQKLVSHLLWQIFPGLRVSRIKFLISWWYSVQVIIHVSFKQWASLVSWLPLFCKSRKFMHPLRSSNIVQWWSQCRKAFQQNMVS